MPVRPKRAWALRVSTPNNPSSTKPLPIHPDLAKEGSRSVNSQTPNPQQPGYGPGVVALFPVHAAEHGGANWATAEKEMSPMPTRA